MSNCYLCDLCKRSREDRMRVSAGWCERKPGTWRRIREKPVLPDGADPRAVCGLFERKERP